MPPIARAIPWAIAMILLAVGERYGLVESRSAATMFAVLPALAVVTMPRRRRCGLSGCQSKGEAL
jgi:ethanolamine ammonia-lyase small subunit